MVSEQGILSHYLMNFMLYTLGAVALIYLVFWYGKQQMGKKAEPAPPAEEAPAPESTGPVATGGLDIEAVLPMENTQTLYVVRAGRERFLLATSEKDTKLISRLDHAAPASDPATAPSPWFTAAPPEPTTVEPLPTTFSDRFAKSLRWLVESRSGK